jgi:tRNA-dihydrouridine synthase B
VPLASHARGAGLLALDLMSCRACALSRAAHDLRRPRLVVRSDKSAAAGFTTVDAGGRELGYNSRLPQDPRNAERPMQFAGYTLRNNLFVAPMAGVTDRPFRQLCKRMGAGLAVSEMVTSNSLLYGSAKTKRRANHEGEVQPVSVQIAGADPAMMAQAARYNVDHGAQIIDINMGCPAKKVCNVMAGSALLQNEPLVGRILDAVVAAVPMSRHAEDPHRLGQVEQECAGDPEASPSSAGIRALAIHGRTRACGYTGQRRIRHHRRGQGGGAHPGHRQRRHHLAGKGEAGARRHRRRRRHDRPRRPGPAVDLPRDRALPRHRREMPPPRVDEIHQVLRGHLAELYAFYGEETGVRVARKHISWYTKGLAGSAQFRHAMNQLPTVDAQLAASTNSSSASPRRTSVSTTSRNSPHEPSQQPSRSEIAECVRRSPRPLFQGPRRREALRHLRHGLRNIERPMLEVVMREADGNQTVAAEMLGINRNTLRRKLGRAQAFVVRQAGFGRRPAPPCNPASNPT